MALNTDAAPASGAIVKIAPMIRVTAHTPCHWLNGTGSKRKNRTKGIDTFASLSSNDGANRRWAMSGVYKVRVFCTMKDCGFPGPHGDGRFEVLVHPPLGSNGETVILGPYCEHHANVVAQVQLALTNGCGLLAQPGIQ